LLAFTPGVDQTGPPEYLQVVRHRWLADVPHLGHQVADTQLATTEYSHNPLTRLVGYSFAKGNWIGRHVSCLNA